VAAAYASAPGSFHACYLNLGPYADGTPPSRLGPMTVEPRTFVPVKSFVSVAARAGGEAGAVLVAPENVYFVRQPQGSPAGTAIELGFPARETTATRPLRVVFAADGLREAGAESAVTLRLQLPEQTAPAAAEAARADLVARIATVQDAYARREREGKATGALSIESHRRALEACAGSSDTAVAKAASEATARLASLQVNAAPAAAADPGKPAYAGPTDLPGRARAFAEAALARLGALRVQAFYPLFALLAGIVGFRVAYFRHFRSFGLTRDFARSCGFSRRGLLTGGRPRFVGTLQEQAVEISHRSVLGSGPAVEASVALPGKTPKGLFLQLKPTAAARGASPPEAATTASDEDFFVKHVVIRAAVPNEAVAYLTTWRMSILRQVLQRKGVLVENSRLVYRSSSLLRDSEELELSLAAIVKSAVSMRIN
jgi:hypothetical protein